VGARKGEETGQGIKKRKQKNGLHGDFFVEGRGLMNNAEGLSRRKKILVGACSENCLGIAPAFGEFGASERELEDGERVKGGRGKHSEKNLAQNERE